VLSNLLFPWLLVRLGYLSESMEEIRAFSEEHVPETARLYLRTVRGQSRPAPPALEDAIRDSFLGNPWVNCDSPSYVYIEDGKQVGFVGVVPRPMEFQSRPIRATTIALWMMDREIHRGIGGMKLLSRVLKGPQDFSYVDGASNEASSIYTALGARVSAVYSFYWMRILRPFRTAHSFFPVLKGAGGVVAAPLDFLLSKLPMGMLKRPKSLYSSKLATAAELLDCIQEARGREALRPAYSMPSFGWLIAQAGTGPGHQGLRLKIVYGPDGERCGWFVYYATPGRIASLLQMGCHRRPQFAEVLRALFEDAWEEGACAVKGRAMPQFLVPLTEQYCVFRQPFACVIGHSRDSEIMNAFQTADAALSGLDAGAWLRFSSEDWT
jgi:hypothetical protein